MIIIGAGMAGLLAGVLNPGSVIFEAGSERKTNHKAIFRCRKPDIGKIIGISFKKVTVYKSIWLDNKEVLPSPRIAHMYSSKVTGTISARSIFNTASAVRYIPPDNFISQLKKRCNIEYNTIFDQELRSTHNRETIISTVPLFNMLKCFPTINIQENFFYQPIYVNRLHIPNCNSHCTIYYPDPVFSAYRASLIGNTLIIEGMKKIQSCDIEVIRESFGIPSEIFPAADKFKEYTQQMGKIISINEEKRKNAITKLTLEFGIYSLGRFATWRPKVMMDDVLEDIFVIRRLIADGHYGSIKHKQGENL